MHYCKIKGVFVTLMVLVAALQLTGCANQQSWVYRPNGYENNSAPVQKTAVVLPFNDERKNDNSNMFMMYLIPLVPFGPQSLEVPEGVPMHITSGLWVNYKPTEDFPKALAEELTNAKMFKETYFDFKQGNADVAIKGKIISTKYNGKIISYGLSAYGIVLWFIGFPATYVTNELSVQLDAVDLKTNTVLMSKAYTATPYETTGWIYLLPSDFKYSSMLQEIYKQFVDDVKKIPSL